MMNKIQIEKVKRILTEWNPLGENSVKITDLNNYETEVIDILFLLNKKSSVDHINKLMAKVLNEAFCIDVDLDASYKYAERIKHIISEE
ncbi:MAG: hypothetical protein IPH45_08180 [Bacteroidales bacterium]|nr:hypothetical protein [Bacteroidales bacterium]